MSAGVINGPTSLPARFAHRHASDEARRIAEAGMILRVQVGSGVHGTSISGQEQINSPLAASIGAALSSLGRRGSVVAKRRGVGNGVAMIVDVPRKGVAAIWCDESAARLEHSADIRLSVPTEMPARQRLPVRAVVEIVRRFSGHPQRALLGGELISHGGESTLIVVNVSPEDLPRRTCVGRLSRAPFVVGMPELLAAGVAAGLTATVDGVLPPSTLTVDRGGYHEVDSSKKSFEQAAMLLGQVLIAELAGDSVEAAARAAIDAWSP